MATDDNNNGFHGYRYLLDAKDSRQYAVPFIDDSPVAPIHVFAIDERETGFRPNETVFAFDDEIEKKRDAQGRITLSTLLFQFGINSGAKPEDGKYGAVAFDVTFELKGTGVDVVYKITPDAARALDGRGFAAGYPKEFRQTVPMNDPGLARDPRTGNIVVSDALVNNLPFPPHQPDGIALIARQSIETSTQSSVVLPRRDDVLSKPQPPAVKPKTDFNKTVTPAPQPPRTLEKPKIPDAAIEAVMKQFCDDLTDKALRGKLDPVVGRDEETERGIKILSRRKQASLCFTGEAGVGKTAMFSAIAQKYADEGAAVRVLLLDLQAMNAGAKFRGQFEEKLKPLIDGLKEREGVFRGNKIILSIDEIHSQLTSGKAEGGTDAGNMMKPFLTAKGISVMGTTTLEEYRKHIEKDGALSSRFEKVDLQQPDEADTKLILQRLWPLYRDHHGLVEDLADEDFDYIVRMTNRYAPNDANPRKGEKVMDTAGAGARRRGSAVIEKQDIIDAVAQMSGLAPEFLNQSDKERFLQMKEEMPKRILGQPAVGRVVSKLIGARSGLGDPNRPWASFVFQGPSGVGKTELCKELARHLFGSDEALIKLDMSEYSEKHTVSRLIGAPPGYVGFDSAEPALTERIRQRPYSILLLDEVEKAHPDVFNVLLSVLNDGKMTDNQGKTVLFNNVIIVMTTNLGASEALSLVEGKGGMAFGGSSQPQDPDRLQKQLSEVYKKAATKHFRPEMINRINAGGGFVTFLPLNEDVIEKLVDRELSAVAKRLSDPTGADFKGLDMEISADIRKTLSKEGYDRAMGARPLLKVISEKIQEPLAEWLMLNSDDIRKFIADNGGAAKVVINSLTDFRPELVAVNAPAIAAVNDNAQKQAPQKRSNDKFGL